MRSGFVLLALAIAFSPAPARAQDSLHALRFFGTGTGQQDRAKFRIDAPASVLDLGGDFTIECWLRAHAAQNTGTVSAAANGIGWITGNVVVDRDIYGGADYGDFGVALGRSGTNLVVGFGAEGGSGRTIVGTNHVGDLAWHHVAVTRASASGQMRIYVDGRLDAEGPGPTGDLSYRDGRSTAWPQSDPFLVLAAEKHDAGPEYPSFNGYLDEFRVWTQVLAQTQITNIFRTVIATNTPGLIAYYRFEEGSGTNLYDQSGLSPVGQLVAGISGNGQWVARAADTNNTAPVSLGEAPGPTAQIHLSTVPAGLPLVVDGITQATPHTVTTAPETLVQLEAPATNLTSGTTYVFRCWSDGGLRAHTILANTNPLTLRAGYAALPSGAASAPVPAANRNAESFANNIGLANVYDGNGLCCGREDGGRYEAALAFPLDLPTGATVQTARITLRATSDQSGTPGILIRAFAISNVAPFTTGSGSVTGLHPLTAAAVNWTPPSFSPGQPYETPDLSAPVQEVVNRADWNAGQFIGLTFAATNTAANHWRCWSNFQSGTPPVLSVTFATSGTPHHDVDGDGIPDEWEAGNGLDCTSSSDAQLDVDRDSFTAQEEYIANTSPTNEASFQRLEIGTATTSNAWKIFFATTTGRLYQVQVTTHLTPPDWQALLTNQPGTGSPFEHTDTNLAPQRFFRQSIRLAPTD